MIHQQKVEHLGIMMLGFSKFKSMIGTVYKLLKFAKRIYNLYHAAVNN